MPQKTETCTGVDCPHHRSMEKVSWTPSRIDVIGQNGATGDHYNTTNIPNEVLYEVLQTTNDNHVLLLLTPYAKGLQEE